VRSQIRFILSNTEELHEEIQRLRGRVKDLETALADMQAHVSTDPHPLLKDPLVLLSPPTPSCKLPQDEEEVLIDTFGSLTIGPDGSSEWCMFSFNIESPCNADAPSQVW